MHLKLKILSKALFSSTVKLFMFDSVHKNIHHFSLNKPQEKSSGSARNHLHSLDLVWDWTGTVSSVPIGLGLDLGNRGLDWTKQC